MASRQQIIVMMGCAGVGLALSTATQLRLPGVPLGLSELILLTCMIVHLPLGLGLHGGNTPHKFTLWHTSLLFATLPGFFLTINSPIDATLSLYGLVAYTWVTLLFAWIHYGFDFRRHKLDYLAQSFLVISTLYFLVVLALAWFDPSAVYLQDDIPDFRLDQAANINDDFEPVFRLVGFSSDPNQLALHGLICLFFSLQLRQPGRWLATLVSATAAISVGVLAKSDTFYFSAIVLACVSVFVGIFFHRAYVTGLIVTAASLAIGALYGGRIIRKIQSIASTGDQDEVRVTLWTNGVLAGLERPLVGFGPGAWSGLEGPFGAYESHNSAVEYFSHAGVIGLTILILGLLALGWKAMLSGKANIVAGVVAITAFATFHNVLRHPVFWFAVYYLAANAWSGRRALPGRRRRRREKPSSRGLDL